MASSARPEAGEAFWVSRPSPSDELTFCAVLFWRLGRRRRSRRWRLRFVLGLNREQFNFKNQGRTGTDTRARVRSAIAITQIRWNKELPFRSHRHELETFRPTLDDASHWERRRLSALVGAVEFLAVNQRAPVVTRDRVGRGGLWSGALGQNLVLQAARESDHAFLGLVGLQKIGANFLVSLRGQFHFFFLSGAAFDLKLRERGFHFGIRQERLAAREGVLHTP